MNRSQVDAAVISSIGQSQMSQRMGRYESSPTPSLLPLRLTRINANPRYGKSLPFFLPSDVLRTL